MEDFRKTRYGKIDLNKLTRPVLNLAEQKAEDYKRRLSAKYNRDEKKQNFRNDKEQQIFEEKWQIVFDDVYDLSLVDRRIWEKAMNICPTDGDSLLAHLSRRYLYMNPKCGSKIIVEAYNEYHGKGAKCKRCGKIITQAKKGRSKRYCSDKCRQRDYRDRRRIK